MPDPHHQLLTAAPDAHLWIGRRPRMKAKKPAAKPRKAMSKKKVGDLGMPGVGGVGGMLSRPTGGMAGTRPPGAPMLSAPTTSRPTGAPLGTKFSPAPKPAPAVNPGYGPPQRNDVLFNRRHPKKGI